MTWGDYLVKYLFEYSYNFEEPDLKVFAVDKKLVSICDKKAYEIPSSQCQYSSDVSGVVSSNIDSAQSCCLSMLLLLACFLFFIAF